MSLKFTKQEFHLAARATVAGIRLTDAREEIERLRAEVSMSQRAFEIADEAMIELLRSETVPVGNGWLSTGYPSDPQPAVAEALAWLEPRGLIERNPSYKGLVRIKE